MGCIGDPPLGSALSLSYTNSDGTEQVISSKCLRALESKSRSNRMDCVKGACSALGKKRTKPVLVCTLGFSEVVEILRPRMLVRALVPWAAGLALPDI